MWARIYEETSFSYSTTTLLLLIKGGNISSHYRKSARFYDFFERKIPSPIKMLILLRKTLDTPTEITVDIKMGQIWESSKL